MRNYVIINGVNSLTIQGLAINIMPPISKPPMRALREEIDGRDGDITTELGYGSYDKTIEVGLYGNYDIDEVIAFFNSKGTIVFSDEDDKYYNFEITDRIDYSKLVKFRTASINFHCQPFKYPLNETPLEEEYEYVEGEGTELTLNDTANAIFNKFDLLGNTSQNGTPTPSSPIPVNVVSGDNTIDICGKNLFNEDTITARSYVQNDGTLLTGTSVDYNTSDFIPIQPNTAYYKTETGSPRGKYYDANKQPLNTTTYQDIPIGNQEGTFTTPNNAHYLRITINTSIISLDNVMIHKGSTATNYEPYIGNTYPIYLGVENLIDTIDIYDGFTTGAVGSTIGYNASANTITYKKCAYVEAGKEYILYWEPNTPKATGNREIRITDSNDKVLQVKTYSNANNNTSTIITPTSNGWVYACLDANATDVVLQKGTTIQHLSTTPIELCKIGTYQDYIYKDNGSWYLHKEIGKVELGDYSYTRNTTSTAGLVRYSTTAIPNIKYVSSNTQLGNGIAQNYSNHTGTGMSSEEARYHFAIDTAMFQVATDDGATPTGLFYYALATPTNTLIEDTTLIEQLESLSIANSIQGQTNINQENNDLPFILEVSTLKDGSDHLIINNIGNIYAKPTLDLEGNGIVGIYLNDTQMFEVDLSETNEIVINTQEMEAYNPTTNALANRQVVGDYSKFKLDSGENDLRFSGALTKATITRYVRWL